MVFLLWFLFYAKKIKIVHWKAAKNLKLLHHRRKQRTMWVSSVLIACYCFKGYSSHLVSSHTFVLKFVHSQVLHSSYENSEPTLQIMISLRTRIFHYSFSFVCSSRKNEQKYYQYLGHWFLQSFGLLNFRLRQVKLQKLFDYQSLLHTVVLVWLGKLCCEVLKFKDMIIVCSWFLFLWLFREHNLLLLFHAALETLVELANVRSSILETHDALIKASKKTKEWQKGGDFYVQHKNS